MRVCNWDLRLVEWAASRVGLPFAWGQTDCGVLAAEVIDVLTGSLIAPAHRGQYADLRGCIDYQRRAGCTVRDGVVQAGGVPVAPGMQQRGDLLLAPWREHYWGSVVCLGKRSLAAIEGERVMEIDTRLALAAPGLEIYRVS